MDGAVEQMLLGWLLHDRSLLEHKLLWLSRRVVMGERLWLMGLRKVLHLDALAVQVQLGILGLSAFIKVPATLSQYIVVCSAVILIWTRLCELPCLSFMGTHQYSLLHFVLCLTSRLGWEGRLHPRIYCGRVLRRSWWKQLLKQLLCGYSWWQNTRFCKFEELFFFLPLLNEHVVRTFRLSLGILTLNIFPQLFFVNYTSFFVIWIFCTV